MIQIIYLWWKQKCQAAIKQLMKPRNHFMYVQMVSTYAKKASIRFCTCESCDVTALICHCIAIVNKLVI